MNDRKVLIVEDDEALRLALCETLQLAGHAVVGAREGGEAMTRIASDPSIALVVSDVQMSPMDGHALLERLQRERPDLPVVLMTAYGTIDKAVAAMRQGARDYLVKPFDAEVLLEMVERFLPHTAQADEPMVVADPLTERMAALARKVAASDATVLILGESGTGKEVLARYIHHHSLRADGPFVAVNCAAIPENMLEAILFGHEKGAFTGAHQARPGKFEQAQGGTLLLDEISEMDPSLQAKLLRVLQEREVERLGGRRPVSLDVRVLATSNRDLAAAVAEGRFRQDLYYRLNVFPLQVPPLRARPRDILPLARRFLVRHTPVPPVPELTPQACERLRNHGWPGNVRELENVIQRALILRVSDRIGPEEIQFELLPLTSDEGAPAPSSVAPTAERLEDDLRRREADLILAALAEGGSRAEVARRLGISPRTLRYKLARLREAGISVPA